MTKRVKYRDLKGVDFSKPKVVSNVFTILCVVAPQSWHRRRPSLMLFLSSGIWLSHIGQILYESCQEHLGHFMINVPCTLEFSQCSQGFSEWKVVDVSWLLLSVSSLSFSVSLLLSWVSSASLPFSEATSSSSCFSISDELSSLILPVITLVLGSIFCISVAFFLFYYIA